MKTAGQSIFWFLFCLPAILTGCATQPAPPPDPFAAMEAMEVHVCMTPPPNSKYLTKVLCSFNFTGTNCLLDCENYIRTQAVLHGGNVIVPEKKLDWAFGYAPTYGQNDPQNYRYVFSSPSGHQHYLGMPAEQTALSRIRFWCKIYNCPDFQ